jgi:hypothetical protein
MTLIYYFLGNILALREGMGNYKRKEREEGREEIGL